MNAIFGHWKTTLSGSLTALLSLCGIILSAKMNPNLFPEYSPFISLLSAKEIGYISAVALLGKMYMSAIQKDPDKTMAQLPGQSVPQAVSAHPVPDDPNAKVISPSKE